MGRIVRPEIDFSAKFREYDRRLALLERHNAIDYASAAGLPIADSTGLLVLKSAGFAANGDQGAYSTANSSTWHDITNTAFTMTIPVATRIIYMVYVAFYNAAGNNNAYVRGNIVGFDTSAALITKNNGATTFVTTNGFLWYFTGEGGAFPSIPAGTYTVKLQAATDTSADSVHIVQFFHQIFLLGA